MKDLDQLFADISLEISQSNPKLPPTDSWNPPLSGDIDIYIARNGEWFHEGGLIGRQSLVKIFSSILKKEGDDYFLVTPVEKWRIRVEDAPFSIVSLDVVNREDIQLLVFQTSVGDRVVAGPENPLRVANSSSGDLTPYLHVRKGMEGMLSRPVFYRLAELAVSGPDKEKAVQGVYSLGVFFPLE